MVWKRPMAFTIYTLFKGPYKYGDWNKYCKDGNFLISYSESENYWEVCIHASCASFSSDVPPKDGWKVLSRAFNAGVGAPQLQY